MNNVIAYTDGASSGNPGPSGWAVLINGELISDWVECATNNQMELFAAYQAVCHCPTETNLTIITDSKLVQNLLSGRWRTEKEWLADIVRDFRMLIRSKQIRVAIERVKGHSDCEENVRVDRAAVANRKIAKSAVLARAQT